MSSKDELRAARAELQAARKALAAVPASDGETPEYLAANQRVIEAEKKVPWIYR